MFSRAILLILVFLFCRTTADGGDGAGNENAPDPVQEILP